LACSSKSSLGSPIITVLTGPPLGYNSAIALALNCVAASDISGCITVDKPLLALCSSSSS
jgi:hypothetical protein